MAQLRGGVRVEGGTLATTGDGLITLDSKTTLDGVMNPGLTQVSSARARLAGTNVNHGAPRVNSFGSMTIFPIEGGVRLEGTGDFTASNAIANTLNAAAGIAGSVLTQYGRSHDPWPGHAWRGHQRACRWRADPGRSGGAPYRHSEQPRVPGEPPQHRHNAGRKRRDPGDQRHGAGQYRRADRGAWRWPLRPAGRSEHPHQRQHAEHRVRQLPPISLQGTSAGP